MIVGYILIGSDNDTFMYEGVQHDNPPLCTKCGYLKKFDYHNPFYKQKKKTFDVSHPYDFGFIVSLKFKEFCERNNYGNILFKEFEQSPGFYQLIITRNLPFSGRLLTKHCEVCGNYEEAIGPKATFSYALPDGFYRSDIAFGTRNRKSYLEIVAPDTYVKMKKEKFKGLYFEKIEA
ncbi:MAG TPA: hypothetical protein PLM56_11365 [Cyclobacteriaceae bacterium]|jgi:hypothetical protein|nr:hypothetical protein [Cyclobacteriaceae bacterium]